MNETAGVVIVGGGMGALRTAEAVRRQGVTLPITIIGQEPYLPYNRPPLSKDALRSESISHEDVAFPIRESVADVRWVLDREVVSSDLDARIVHDSAGVSYPFDYLVAATGLRPRRSDLSDAHAEVLALHSLDDAIALRDVLRPEVRLVILGGGFVALELAATARGIGCDVTVVSRSQNPLGLLGDEMSAALVGRHESEGVKFVRGRIAVAFRGETGVSGVVLDDGDLLACDVVVEAIGASPRTEWLEGNGLDLTDGLLTDAHLRAARRLAGPSENVYAVGDVARFPHWLAEGMPRRVGHWSNPTDSAKHVASEIAAREAGEVLEKEFEPIPTFWSDQYDLHLFSIGLPELHDSATTVLGTCEEMECVVEYHREDKLVGVAGIGHRSVVQGYKERFTRGKVVS